MKTTDDKTTTYTVVYVVNGRMHPCDHKHFTPEAAHDCVKALGGISIIEWVYERRPQFQEYWRHPDLKES